MTDRIPDDLPADPGGLPMQPTGSGVADLAVAYEQMKLAGEGEMAEDDLPTAAADGSAAD